MAGIPQTSASDRVEAAREVLAEYRRSQPSDYERAYADPLADALRALITPPGVGESERQIAERAVLTWDAGKTAVDNVEAAVRAGFQSAHETWEPSDHPSQEMMLRWLGLDYTEDGDVIIVHRKVIEREEI